MTNKINKIMLDESSLVRGGSKKHERERIITDILEKNNFTINDKAGPYDLYLQILNNKLEVEIKKGEEFLDKLSISLMPLKRVIKDYYIICESYFDAVKHAGSQKVEAIDMGRRGVHDEGAEILVDLLGDNIRIDHETSRKLFTLVYLLQIK